MTQPQAPKGLDAAPAFAVVGLLGFVVDSALTYGLMKYAALPFAVARVAGVVVATVFNFALNRRFTFQATHLPVVPAFVRYVAVASAGLAVNYATSVGSRALAGALGAPPSPILAPIYIALGVGAAMALTFEGFRRYAFRDHRG
jgi:putative flippase GtrA